MLAKSTHFFQSINYKQNTQIDFFSQGITLDSGEDDFFLR